MTGELHLDLETLAELAEGLLESPTAEHAREHVSTCSLCTARLSAVTAVPGILAAVPVPSMPPDVAARVDAALAAERPLAAASTPQLNGAWRRRRIARWTMSAAAATVLVVGGGLVLRTTTAPTAKQTTPGDAAAPAAPSRSAEKGEQLHALPTVKLRFTVKSTGSDYTNKDLYVRVKSVLGAPSARVAREGTADTDSPGESASQTKDHDLEPCIVRLANQAGQPPVLVDRAKWQGRPATIVVFQAGDIYDVWAVGPGCSATADDLIHRSTARR